MGYPLQPFSALSTNFSLFTHSIHKYRLQATKLNYLKYFIKNDFKKVHENV